LVSAYRPAADSSDYHISGGVLKDVVSNEAVTELPSPRQDSSIKFKNQLKGEET
jgi:hypothetical protein